MSDFFDFMNDPTPEKGRFDDVEDGDYAVTISKIDENWVSRAGNKGWLVLFDAAEYPGVPLTGYLMKTIDTRWKWREFFAALGLTAPDPAGGVFYKAQDLVGMRIGITVLEENNFKGVKKFFPVIEQAPADWSEELSQPTTFETNATTLGGSVEQLEAFPSDGS